MIVDEFERADIRMLKIVEEDVNRFNASLNVSNSQTRPKLQ